MHPILQALWAQHGAASFEKQWHLGPCIQGLDWSADLLEGVVRFGASYAWRVQLLGTEVADAGVWRWAWADERLALPEASTVAARSLQAFGASRDVPALTRPEIALGDDLGHVFGMIAAGALAAGAYLVLPFAGGLAYLLVQDPDYPAPERGDLSRAAAVFPQFLGLRAVDARKAWRHYLRYHGLDVVDAGPTTSGRGARGAWTGTFDEHGRLRGITG